METIKKNFEVLLTMSASLIDGFTSLTITSIKKVNSNIDILVHYKYYSNIEFDILLRMTIKNGIEILEIHHSSVLFNNVFYHPDFIFANIQQSQRNELLLEKTKAVLELLQKRHSFIKTQLYIAKPTIETILK